MEAQTPAAPGATAGPLTDLKVVELGQLIAGPFAAKTLAENYVGLPMEWE